MGHLGGVLTAATGGKLPWPDEAAANAIDIWLLLGQCLEDVAGGIEQGDGLLQGVEGGAQGQPNACELGGTRMLGCDHCALESEPEGAVGGRGAWAEALGAAVLDDDERGNEGVGFGEDKVPDGLPVGEVREEAGEEGDEAIEGALLHVLVDAGERRGPVDGICGGGKHGADDYVGDRIEQADAGRRVEEP